jgi:signal transduction histidine kinase
MHLLGENLLRDEVTALLELVKNSYDADSPDCTVKFENLGSASPRIVIEDNGSGMDISTVTTAWCEPGTSFKVRKPVTEKGRRVQGEKGIGRFAVDKLAKRLDMYTKTKGMTEVIHFIVDWEEFDNSDKYLEDVKATYSFENIPFREKGTTLILSSLRKEWQYNDIQDVRYGLVRLVPPNRSGDDFTINLQVARYPWLQGIVRNNIIERAPFRIKAALTDGVLKATVFRNIRNEKTETTKSIVVQDKDSIVPIDKIKALGPLEVNIGAFLRTKSKGRPKDTLFPSISISEEDSKSLEQWHGVSIYSDGFWIYPYGEAWFDWLGLAGRRVMAPGKRFDNNQLVGFVMISRDGNPGLVQQINREGLVHNDAYATLQAVVLSILATLESDAIASGARKRIKETSGNEVTAKPVSEVVEESLGEVQKKIEQGIAEVSQGSSSVGIATLRSVAKDVQSIASEIKKDLIIYERHAIIGMFVDYVIHEINTSSDLLRLKIDTMINRLNDLNLEINTKEKIVMDFTKLDDYVQKLIEHVHRWSPFINTEAAKITVELREHINGYMEDFSRKYPHMKFEIVCPQPVKANIAETYFFSILQNLVDNSGYWTSKVADPTLRITIFEDNGLGIIRVSDNGPGISQDERKNVFIPSWSSKPNGYGIGLKLAGESAAILGGSLVLLDKSELGTGASFELRLPVVKKNGD